ncbi:MAG: hybrid sensor histidine kinase/response regulator [Pseudomonadota bacterium]
MKKSIVRMLGRNLFKSLFVLFILACISLCGVIFIINIIEQNKAENAISNSVFYALQEPVRNSDLISIIRIIKSYQKANYFARFCINLNGGTELIQEKECSILKKRIYKVPLSDKNILIAIKAKSTWQLWYVVIFVSLMSFILLLIILKIYKTGNEIASEIKILGTDIEFNNFQYYETFITQRKIIKIKEELKQKSRLASVGQTAAMIAHDVRKPFTSLEVLLGLIPARKNDDEFMKKAMNDIRGQRKQVSDMLNDILEFTGKKEANIEKCNPATIISSAIFETRASFNDTFVEFIYDLKHTGYYNIDIYKVTRVFTNIIGNAVEAMKGVQCKAYSVRREDEDINEIWFKTCDGEIEGKKFIQTTIGNSGSFISNEDKKRLFEAYFTKNKKGGTGLGLAICKKVIMDHGGSIQINSDKESGTEFVFTLPYLDGDESLVNLNLIKNSTQILDQNETHDSIDTQDMLSSINDINKKLGRKLRLLVLDDEPLFRLSLRNLIIKSEELSPVLDISEHESPESVLEYLKETEVDYAILDIDLGVKKMNGLELCKIISDKYPSIKMIIHSNKNKTENEKQAKKAGALEFVPKPMTVVSLLSFLSLSILDNRSLEFGTQSTELRNQHKDKRKGDLKILVVDDEFIISMGHKILINDYFKKRNFVKSEAEIIKYEILTATDPEMALEILKSEKIDIILSDFYFDGKSMNGTGLVSEASKLDPKIRCFVISNSLGDACKQEVFKAGAKEYFQAPLTCEMLDKMFCFLNGQTSSFDNNFQRFNYSKSKIDSDELISQTDDKFKKLSQLSDKLHHDINKPYSMAVLTVNEIKKLTDDEKIIKLIEDNIIKSLDDLREFNDNLKC